MARSGPSPVRGPVRSAQRPQPSSGARERVILAWARHPLVAMARHRRRVTFFTGLLTLLRSGVPLNIAFTELSRGAATDPFRRAVAAVAKAVAGGAGLAEAMRGQPLWFEPHVVAAVEAAEVSGTLEEALVGIIRRLEELQSLRWRTLSMCLYPAWLLLAFLVGGTLLEGAGGVRKTGGVDSLPMALVSAFGVRLLKVTMAGLAVFSAPLALAALDLQERWERVRVRIPGLGAFYRRTQASRFCQVLGSSLGAGVDAERSLRMAIEATGSTVLRERVNPAILRLRDGATLTDVVEWLGVLDGESLRHVGIGERSGRMEILLLQQARENSEAGLRSLMALMIGLVIVLVGSLLVTNIAHIFDFQRDYYQRIEELSHG